MLLECAKEVRLRKDMCESGDGSNSEKRLNRKIFTRSNVKSEQRPERIEGWRVLVMNDGPGFSESRVYKRAIS